MQSNSLPVADLNLPEMKTKSPPCPAGGVHMYATILILNMNHITRKPVFRVSDQVRLRPACSATETSYSLEILDLVSLYRYQVSTIWIANNEGADQTARMPVAKTGFPMTWLIYGQTGLRKWCRLRSDCSSMSSMIRIFSLPFSRHLLNTLMYGKIHLSNFRIITPVFSGVSIFFYF